MGSTHGFAGLFVSARHFWQTIRVESVTALHASFHSEFQQGKRMSTKSRKPYTVIGAERLTSSLYKTGDELTGFKYRFNIVRLNNHTGRVNQWFRPNDLVALMKLTQVLASELNHDGCGDAALRQQLRRIAAVLDRTLDEIASQHTSDGATEQ